METVHVMIRKRKNSKGQPCYQVIIRDNDGHPPKYETFPTMQEAKDWEFDERSRRRKTTYFPEQVKKSYTLTDLIDRYLELLPLLGKKSIDDIICHLKWWKNEIGKSLLNHVTSDLLAKCRNNLLKSVSPSTVNRYTASLSTVLTYGMKECGWLENNPMFRVTKLKEPSGRNRVLNPEEYACLIHSAENSKNTNLKTIIQIALLTGMRQGEILSLYWDDIKFDLGCICIRTSKNNRPRVVPLDNEIAACLKGLYANRNPNNPLVFASKKRFGKITIRKAFDEALKRANISNFHFHDLRHTYSTYANYDGCNPITLMTSLGHSTVNMSSHYTHPGLNEMRSLGRSVRKNLMKESYEQS